MGKDDVTIQYKYLVLQKHVNIRMLMEYWNAIKMKYQIIIISFNFPSTEILFQLSVYLVLFVVINCGNKK